MIERQDTKSRILDTAENLFGLNGFDAVSLRDITTKAGVNLAAINYHFQSKDTLVDAVIARRIQPINARRLEMLEEAGQDATVEQILEAFLRPAFELKIEPLGPLMGRVLSNPELFVDRIFNVHFAPMGARFTQAFSRALPHLPAEEVMWRHHFTVGSMTHILLWGRLMHRLSNGICSIDDREALLQRAVQFLAAGFRAPAPLIS
jgi:AcrR family transcriptional regulator